MELDSGEFGLHESREEVERIRGSNRQILARIRKKYGIPSSSVRLEELFRPMCVDYHGAANADWKSERDVRMYRKTRELPEYVIRGGDRDVTYPSLRHLGATAHAEA